MDKPQLLLLHGALGSEGSFNQLMARLSDAMDVNAFNFPGHGGLPLPSEDFSCDLFVETVNEFISSQFAASRPVFIFGFSMGGYMALLAALNGNPQIAGIITLATKMNWSPQIAEAECKMLDAETLLQKVPQFAVHLEKTHAPTDWKKLLLQTEILLKELGNTNPLAPAALKEIKCRCLFLLGDRDKMVGLDETLQAYKAVDAAAMGILPFTGHPFEKVNSERLAFEILQFTESF